MTGQIPTSTIMRLYYLLVLASLNHAIVEAQSSTCNVLSETYKPDADVLLGFVGSRRLSSSNGLCDINDASSDQIFEAAKIIVDHLPTSVVLPNVSIGEFQKCQNWKQHDKRATFVLRLDLKSKGNALNNGFVINNYYMTVLQSLHDCV